MAEVRKVFESPVSERKVASKLLDFKTHVVLQTTRLAAEGAWNPEPLFNTFFARSI